MDNCAWGVKIALFSGKGTLKSNKKIFVGFKNSDHIENLIGKR